MMMLGREITLPVDLTVEHPAAGEDTQTDYAEHLRSQIQKAHDRAQSCLGKNMRRQKKNYDRRTTDPGIRENKFVWLFNPAKKKGVCPKLQLRWEGPYLVVKRLSDVVYRIQRSKGARPRVIHVDRLKPYSGDSIVSWTTPEVIPVEGNETVVVGDEQTQEKHLPRSCSCKGLV